MKSLISKLTSAYLLGLAPAILLPTFYCKVNNPLLLRQTDWIFLPVFWDVEVCCWAVGVSCFDGLKSWTAWPCVHAHTHYSPSKHWRLLSQRHSVTPEKTWIFSNTAVRNSNVVCHTSSMSVNRSGHWAAAIIYHFNCKISESSDECDSSKSGDYQSEKKTYWYINSFIPVLYVTISTYCRLVNCLSEILLCSLYSDLGSAG
jgi:hypothetical protein